MSDSRPLDLTPAVTDSRGAAKYLGVSDSYLRASRMKEPRTEGPPYAEAGRAVRYRVADLDRWLSKRTVRR